MNEIVVQDVTTAPSPVIEETTAAPETTTGAADNREVPTLESLTPKQRDEWRKTGEFPKPTTEAPAPSTETSETSSSEPAPASQPDKPQERKKGFDQRKQELSGEIQSLLTQRNTLQQEIERLKTKPGEPAAPPPAAETKPAAADPKDPEPTDRLNPATGKPWKDWGEYDQAKRAWDRREAIREFEAKSARTEQARTEQAQLTQLQKNWKERCEAEVKANSDFKQVAFNKDLPVNQAAFAFMTQSDAGAKILYYLGKNLDTAKQIFGLDPLSTVRILARLELGLSTPAPETAPTPRLTRTPKPPTDLGGNKNALPADDEEAAVAAGDFRRFKEVANRKAIGSKK